MFDVAHMVLVGKVTQSDNLSVLAIINGIFGYFNDNLEKWSVT
jgi:hypothetical protein